MGMEAEWRLRIMTKVSAEIRKNGGLEREGEGKETRRRIQGERRGNSRRTKQAEEKRRVV
jgi:hypothetical protein